MSDHIPDTLSDHTPDTMVSQLYSLIQNQLLLNLLMHVSLLCVPLGSSIGSSGC